MGDFSAAGYRPDGVAAFRTSISDEVIAVYGADLDISPEMPLGELIGIMAAQLANTDEHLARVSNGFSILRSAGQQTQALSENFGIAQRVGRRAVITLSLAGVPGIVIPAGSIAETPDGVQFYLSDPVTLDSNGLAMGATAFSNVIADVRVPVGVVIRIATGVAGWHSVVNTSVSSGGIASETGGRFRRRYQDTIDGLSRSGSVREIRAAVLNAGIAQCRVEVNDGSTGADIITQGITIPENSFVVIAQAPASQYATVAAAIRSRKPPGFPTAGSVMIDGIRFTPAREIPLSITVDTRADFSFPSDGVDFIRSNLVDYSLGVWTAAPNLPEYRGFVIGAAINMNRLLAPINAVPGHDPVSVTVTDSVGNPIPSATSLDALYTVSASDITVNVTHVN